MPYLADRDSGCIEKFDLYGKVLSDIPSLGRTHLFKLGTNGTLWAGTQLLNKPSGSLGWVSSWTARLGYIPVNERAGLHSVEDDEGQRLVWFKKRSLRIVQKSMLQ